ncbi:Fcf1-domain-containing protein [Scenedesmus sp. NREL 46B-D3]|nr:Fcf1-domain-containing protein [Scenedesmus sp. NREL 46B-D3]
MGKAKKTRKFAEVKRLLSPKDIEGPKQKQKQKKDEVRHVEKVSSAMFFKYNTQLGPPYQVLVDTNFINFSIKNKIDLVKGMMDCLYAECKPCITDCVMAELEKLGQKYRVALKVAKDPRIERIPCTHKGTYADDCLCERVRQHKCYIVATCDKDLRRRIRKIPGVPIMYLSQHRYSIERLPEATIGGAPAPEQQLQQCDLPHVHHQLPPSSCLAGVLPAFPAVALPAAVAAAAHRHLMSQWLQQQCRRAPHTPSCTSPHHQLLRWLAGRAAAAAMQRCQQPQTCQICLLVHWLAHQGRQVGTHSMHGRICTPM